MMVTYKMSYRPNRPIGPIVLILPILPILTGIIFNTRAVWGGSGVWGGAVWRCGVRFFMGALKLDRYCKTIKTLGPL